MNQPTIVAEQNGIVILPALPEHWNNLRTLDYMIPLQEIDAKYSNYVLPDIDIGEATDIPGYGRLLRDWYYQGLQALSLELKPNLKSMDGNCSAEHALKRYVSFILQARDASHSHKLAYITYVFDTCCTKITWLVNGPDNA